MFNALFYGVTTKIELSSNARVSGFLLIFIDYVWKLGNDIYTVYSR